MDTTLVDGDQALFQPSFGAATVVVRPGILRASGLALVQGRQLCVVGDETSASVPGCLYVSAAYPIPGSGSLEVASLNSDQSTSTTRIGQQALLLMGSSFTARFKVQTPAQQPSSTGPIPDPTPEYLGQGTFLASQFFVRAG